MRRLLPDEIWDKLLDGVFDGGILETRDVRSLTLHVDEFGQEALERGAEIRHGSTAAVVRTAVLYYLADRDSERAAWRYPRFSRHRAPGPGQKVEIDDDTWAAVEHEAKRQQIEPSQLAEHAFLYFLADLDSGRVAGRLENILEDE